MSWSHDANQIVLGDEVVDSAGEKLGNVADVQAGYIMVEKGLFFISDYSIPFSAITQVDHGQVVLNVSRDQALNSGWDTVPEATTIGLREPGMMANDIIGTTDVVDTTTTRVQGQPQVTAYEATSEDAIVIPLREEELTATVRDVEAGAARIQKRVVSEDRVLEVPVTEEQIRVQRRVVDRATDATDGQAFEEIVIEIPLTAQQVELRKQARVTEELVVTKETIQHTEQVRGTVRREAVEVIEDVTVIRDVEGGTTPRR